jgi:hypothetical protein
MHLKPLFSNDLDCQQLPILQLQHIQPTCLLLDSGLGPANFGTTSRQCTSPGSCSHMPALCQPHISIELHL